MKSFYDILGVSKFASDVEIKKAYILRSKMMHPDRFNQNTQKEEWSMANEMLKELNHAYGVLKDPVSRSTYDRTMGGVYSQQSAPPPQSSTRSSPSPNSEAEPPPIRKKQQYQSPPRIVPLDISHWIYILLFFGVLGYFMLASWTGGKPTSPQATKNAGITSPPRQKYTPFPNAVFGLDAEITKIKLPEGCVEDFSNILEAQKALKAYQKQLETLNTGPISGWIIRLNPFKSDASSVDLVADSLIPTLARGLHGRFVESDFALYKKIIPNLMTDRNVASHLFDDLMMNLENTKKISLDVLEKAVYEVSILKDSDFMEHYADQAKQKRSDDEFKANLAKAKAQWERFEAKKSSEMEKIKSELALKEFERFKNLQESGH